MASSRPVQEQDGAALMTRYGRYAVFVLFTVNTLNYVDRMVLAVLVESIRLDIPLSDTQIGLLTGLVFAIFYSVAGLAIGRLSDIMNRKRLLVLSIGAWSLATAASGAAMNFAHLFAARLAVGVGEAGTFPASQSLIADFCSFRARPTAFAIVAGAGGGAGIAIGLAGGGFIADAFGWRMAFLATGLLGLPVILLVALTLKEPVRGQQESGSDKMLGASYRTVIHTLVARRSFPLLVLATSCSSFVGFGMAQWVPAYLIRAFGVTTAEVGLYFGMAMGLGSAIGAIAGGGLCSWLLNRDMGWLLRLPIIVSLVILPLYLAAFNVSSFSIALLLILVVNIVSSFQFGALLAAVHSVVPAGMRGIATSLFGLLTSLLGAGLAPFAIGVMSDVLGDGAQDVHALRLSLSIATLMCLGTVTFLLLARRHISRDQRDNGIAHA